MASISSMSPSIEVPAPPHVPYRYGVLSAATVIDAPGRWELGGINYTTPDCPNRTTEWVPMCPPEPPIPPEKNIPVGLDQVEGKPFMLYDAVACYPHTGRTEQELLTIAREALVAGEQEKIEEKVWEQIRQDAVILAPPPQDPPPPVPNAWPFAVGVGVLEEGIAKLYGGIGVLHAPRFLLAVATSLKLTQRDGDRLLDPGDNPWAFGAGYSLNGPPVEGSPNNPAPARYAWVFGTGPVVIRRSEIQLHTAFDPHNNERRALAERSYVFTVECPALAVLIKIPER